RAVAAPRGRAEERLVRAAQAAGHRRPEYADAALRRGRAAVGAHGVPPKKRPATASRASGSIILSSDGSPASAATGRKERRPPKAERRENCLAGGLLPQVQNLCAFVTACVRRGTCTKFATIWSWS